MYEIVAVRRVPSDDESHMHIGLVGYMSSHLPEEPIMISPARVIQRIAFGDTFSVLVDGEPAEVQAGACAECGLEPYLKTAKDSSSRRHIEGLPSR